MLFDVQAALAEILATPIATPATSATPTSEIAPVSQVSRVSQSQPPEIQAPAKAALAEILNDEPRRCDSCDSRDLKEAESQESRESQSQQVKVSTPQRVATFTPPSAPEPSRPQPDAFPYGRNFDGRPSTWTGKVVSLDEWRRLSDWDKHGSSGKVWNGITRKWEPMDGGAA